jgi:hypothetical protein
LLAKLRWKLDDFQREARAEAGLRKWNRKQLLRQTSRNGHRRLIWKAREWRICQTREAGAARGGGGRRLSNSGSEIEMPAAAARAAGGPAGEGRAEAARRGAAALQAQLGGRPGSERAERRTRSVDRNCGPRAESAILRTPHRKGFQHEYLGVKACAQGIREISATARWRKKRKSREKEENGGRDDQIPEELNGRDLEVTMRRQLAENRSEVQELSEKVTNGADWFVHNISALAKNFQKQSTAEVA